MPYLLRKEQIPDSHDAHIQAHLPTMQACNELPAPEGDHAWKEEEMRLLWAFIRGCATPFKAAIMPVFSHFSQSPKPKIYKGVGILLT